MKKCIALGFPLLALVVLASISLSTKTSTMTSPSGSTEKTQTNSNVHFSQARAALHLETDRWQRNVERVYTFALDRAMKLLSAKGMPCATADVLRLHVPNEPGNLAEVAQALGDAGINIDYAYTLTSTVPGETAFVLAVIDPDVAEDVLE